MKFNEFFYSLAQIYSKNHFGVSIVRPTDGGVNYTYFLGNPISHVLKLSSSNPELMKKEARALEFWKSNDIPVPDVVKLDTSCSIFESDVLILKYVLHEKEEPNPFFSGELLKKLHSFKLHDDLSCSKMKTYYGWKDFLIKHSHENSQINEFINSSDYDFTPTLLHGDYCPGHILMNKGNLAAVIDPDPVVGDPLWDVAFYLVHYPEHRDLFLKGYFQNDWSSDENNTLNVYEQIVCFNKINKIKNKIANEQNPSEISKMKRKLFRYDQILRNLSK